MRRLMAQAAQKLTTQLSEFAQAQVSEAVINLAVGQPSPSLLPATAVARASGLHLAGDPLCLQ
eukprot:NODE_2435_length_926_cov_43.874572_g2003_i0.p4 GENE.NODE_2435_length_926_cov_43.874572_g2003_i0~~NODE_2435_length_926_cov_43.874572_g2003_i0.p4  ORF type:complete len:63 (-),score=16.10 NODE_2435_length_926_cov_43.874572_g2003_i0:632-820(-)